MKKLLSYTLTAILAINVVVAQKAPTTRAEWEQKLRLAKHDTTRLTCYTEILRIIYPRDSSITYFLSKMQPLIKKYPNHYGGIVFFTVKSDKFIFTRSDSVMYYLSKAHELSKKLKLDFYSKASAINMADNGSPSNVKRLTDFLRVLKEHKFDPKNDSDKRLLFYVYSKIGEAYSFIENMHDKALHYSNMSKNFMSTTSDSVTFFRNRIIIMANISDAFIQEFHHTYKISYSSSCRPFFDEAIAFCERNKGNDDILSLHHKLLVRFSKIHLIEKNYTAAIEFSNRSQQIEIPKRFSKSIQMQLDLNLGQIYIGLGQYQKGIDLLGKVKGYHEQKIQLLPSNDANHYLSETYQYLVKGYKAMGDYKKAYEALEKYNAINHAFYGTEQTRMAMEFEKQSELFEKQQQIAQQNFDILLKNQQLKTEQEQANVLKLKTSITLASKEKAIANQQNKLHTQEINLKNKEERLRSEQEQKNILAALFSVCFLLFCLSLWSYKKQLLLKKSLGQQNIQLQNQAQILETKTKELAETIQIKDKIFAVLGHDLRSPLNELKTILMLFYAQDITPSKMKELMASLTTKMEGVQGMMNNLFQWSLIELKHQAMPLKSIALTPIIQKVVTQLETAANKKQITVKTHLVPAQILGNAEDLEIVVRNLLSNAIKFTPKGGFIQLNITEKDGNIELNCTDTGVGMPASALEPSANFVPHNIGTAGETGTGLGLKVSTELVKRNNGNIAIESTAHKGTTIKLIFSKFDSHNSKKA